MLRSVDIAVLLKLTLAGAAEASFQRLAEDMHLSPSEVHAAFKRVRQAGLMQHDGARQVNRSALMEFLEHGMRYSFPAQRGELTRGVPTAYAAEPLKSLLRSTSEDPPVWPYLEGRARGYSFAPLYKHAAVAAMKDPKLYELLSLADALRDGKVRERKLATEELRHRLTPDA